MKTYIVDAFTEKPFAGNPAGVCLVESPISDETMLQVAQELGFSETAFVTPTEHSELFSIRFFSPKMEIPLCGHATLASAKVLFEDRQLSTVRFTNIDNLELTASEVNGEIVLEFPVYETQPAEAPTALLAALNIDAVENVSYNIETKILLLEIKDPEELAGLAPDFAALYDSHNAINGVLVTAPSGTDGYDFHSRYFWPWSGTNEDPVTGAPIRSLQNTGQRGSGKRRCGRFSRPGGQDICGWNSTAKKCSFRAKPALFSGER